MLERGFGLGMLEGAYKGLGYGELESGLGYCQQSVHDSTTSNENSAVQSDCETYTRCPLRNMVMWSNMFVFCIRCVLTVSFIFVNHLHDSIVVLCCLQVRQL